MMKANQIQNLIYLTNPKYFNVLSPVSYLEILLAVESDALSLHFSVFDIHLKVR